MEQFASRRAKSSISGAVLSENSIRLGVRVGRQNHRMIGTDAGGPALARNVRHRLFKSRRRLEAENLFLRHQLSICLEACAAAKCPFSSSNVCSRSPVQSNNRSSEGLPLRP